jgi:hypothetical protein
MFKIAVPVDFLTTVMKNTIHVDEKRVNFYVLAHIICHFDGVNVTCEGLTEPAKKVFDAHFIIIKFP